jgi:hypothetical protein
MRSLGARIGRSPEACVEGASMMGVKLSLVPVSPMPSQTPPDGHSTNVAGQAAFRLQHLPGAARSEGSHTYVRPDTLWNGDVMPLWLRRNSDKVWDWNSGLPLQLAHEVTEIPFDQRSLAQRWAVREATRALVLPEDFATPEPDIEWMAQRNEIPHFLRKDEGSLIMVEDWTAWSFLDMTQPDQSQEVIDWFWWTACNIFIGDKLLESPSLARASTQ